MRYIPAEVVAAYVAAQGALASTEASPIVLWIVVGLLVVLTPIWTIYATNVPGKPKAVFQAAAATVAFAVWVFALGGPFAPLAWYDPVYGSLALIFATLVIPLAEKICERSPSS